MAFIKTSPAINPPTLLLLLFFTVYVVTPRKWQRKTGREVPSFSFSFFFSSPNFTDSGHMAKK